MKHRLLWVVVLGMQESHGCCQEFLPTCLWECHHVGMSEASEQDACLVEQPLSRIGEHASGDEVAVHEGDEVAVTAKVTWRTKHRANPPGCWHDIC